jgi:hypothetical protein
MVKLYPGAVRYNLPSVLEEDNQAAILLSKRGRGGFTRAKHIKVKYFSLKDLVEEGQLKLQYVGTKAMVSDLLTKPVIGAQFNHLLSKLLGWETSSK